MLNASDDVIDIVSDLSVSPKWCSLLKYVFGRLATAFIDPVLLMVDKPMELHSGRAF